MRGIGFGPFRIKAWFSRPWFCRRPTRAVKALAWAKVNQSRGRRR